MKKEKSGFFHSRSDVFSDAKRRFFPSVRKDAKRVFSFFSLAGKKAGNPAFFRGKEKVPPYGGYRFPSLTVRGERKAGLSAARRPSFPDPLTKQNFRDRITRKKVAIMDFDRIVRTDIEASERGFTATMRFDEAAIRAMVDEVDAELFDKIAAARGYRRQDVDVTALREIAAKLENAADYGSWQAEAAGRIRAAIEGDEIPKQVSDIPHCPRCLHDVFWQHVGSTDAEGFETLRCAGCGRDYRYKRPEMGGAK